VRPTVKRLLIAILTACLLAATPAFPLAKRSYSTSRRTNSSKGERKKTVHVKSYKKKDGTYVRAHERRVKNASSSTKKIRIPKAMKSRSAIRDEKGRITRSEKARAAVMKSHPCPANGRKSGPCPGYVVDHVRPLANGGADTPSNMQWQTVSAAEAKDKWERKTP
jgi:hypothetical protein